MGKIQLFLLDDQEEYAEKLMSYVRMTDFAKRLHVRLFTDVQKLAVLLEQTMETGILLVSETLYPSIRERNGKLCLLVLRSESDCEAQQQDEPAYLLRFQSLHQLLMKAIGCYEEEHAPVRSGISGGRTQVISLYSSVGSSGKTIAALGLAKQLALRGKRVIYVSLDMFCTANRLLQREESLHFAQLLYYMKSAPALLGPKLKQLISGSVWPGVDILTPGNLVREMQGMGEAEAQMLIEALRSCKEYDFIIIDLEATLHPRIMASLGLSDKVWWLLLDDLNCLYKTKVFLSKAALPASKSLFIMNKYTGRQVSDYAFIGKGIEAFLPYIPNWKQLSAMEQFLADPQFSEQLFAVFVESQSALHSGRAAS